MAPYRISTRSSTNVGAYAGLPLCEILAGPTDYPTLFEIDIGIQDLPFNSSSFVLGFGRPAATGVSTLAASSTAEYAGSPLSGVSVVTEWSSMPTVPARFMRRMITNSPSTTAIFPYIRFLFPGGLSLIANNSAVVWVISGGSDLTRANVIFDINVGFDA